MQLAVIEYARTVLGLPDANSTELDPNTKNPCVVFMPEVWFVPFHKFQLTSLYLNVMFLSEAGIKNAYGRHYEVRLKKNLLPKQGLQSSKTVSTYMILLPFLQVLP